MRQSLGETNHSPKKKGKRTKNIFKTGILSAMLWISAPVFGQSDFIITTQDRFNDLCKNNNINIVDIPIISPGKKVENDVSCYIVEDLSHNRYYRYNPKSFAEKTLSTEQEEFVSEAKEFCSLPMDKLTFSQKELWKILSPEERDDLCKKVRINITEGQIEFLNLYLAIDNQDIAQQVNKQEADKIVADKGNGWILPRDIDFADIHKRTFDPNNSDYDAMISQMPGQSDTIKVEYFKLLTGMKWHYWTSQTYDHDNSFFVIYNFDKDSYEWVGFWSGVRGYNNKCNVRPVKTLIIQ